MAMTPERHNTAPTAQNGEGAGVSEKDRDWLRRAQRAFDSSTTYFDSNLRKEWEDSIRAFNNQHPSDSKYNQPAFDKRSKVYRPRIRTVIRKNEAAAAAAFFSNMDVVSVDPDDPTSKVEAANAAFKKQILQYRLTKTIPWFHIVLGGLQDAQKQGAACSHIYWEYEEEPLEDAVADTAQEAMQVGMEAVMQEPQAQAGETDHEYPQQSPEGMPSNALVADDKGGLAAPERKTDVAVVAPVQKKVRKDQPAIDLVPLENVRFDPGASWIDPVNTSPYWIHLIPMYVMDVKEKAKSGGWKELPDNIIAAATEVKPDSTRIARQAGKDDPYSADNKSISDYEIVWVQRHIHRKEGKDWEFYTMGNLAMLTDPVPLKDVVFTGKRPYVLGVCNLETHKVVPSTIPQLARGLSDETNELANQRMDNIKFVLNKKYLVKRGKEADVPGLVRNVPGGVVMMDDPQGDIKELSWADVTASAFQEAQGLGLEMDELLGNFNPASLMMNGASNNPARNMALLGNSQGTLVEYLLRVYVVTFIEPTLRQLMQLEQEYETDEVVMKIAAKKAKLMQMYGVDQVTDDLLRHELTLTVNVGMGATDPMARLMKFLTAMGKYSEMVKQGMPGIDMTEVGKEIFGHLGYADGSRFFSVEDPQVLQLQQQLQQANGVIQQLQKKVAEKQQAQAIALQKTMVTTQSAEKRDALKANVTLKTAAIKEDGANKRALATHWRALHEQEVNHQHDTRRSLIQAAGQPTRLQ